jgi:hypothetical protein
VLAVEVDVQGRRADPHPPGHLAQGEAHDAVVGHDLDGDVEHLLDGLLPPALPTVEGHRPGHAGNGPPNTVRKSRGS